MSFKISNIPILIDEEDIPSVSQYKWEFIINPVPSNKFDKKLYPKNINLYFHFFTYDYIPPNKDSRYICSLEHIIIKNILNREPTEFDVFKKLNNDPFDFTRKNFKIISLSSSDYDNTGVYKIQNKDTITFRASVCINKQVYTKTYDTMEDAILFRQRTKLQVLEDYV